MQRQLLPLDTLRSLDAKCPRRRNHHSGAGLNRLLEISILPIFGFETTGVGVLRVALPFPGVLVTEFAAPVAKTEPPFDLLFVSEDGRADRCTCGRRIHRTGANVADVWVAPVGVPSAAAAVIWIPLTFGLLTTGVN